MFEDRFLPDPFLKEDGSRIQNPAEWPQQASRIRSLAEENMYASGVFVSPNPNVAYTEGTF